MTYEELKARYHKRPGSYRPTWETFLRSLPAQQLASTILELEERIEDLYCQMQDACEAMERD